MRHRFLISLTVLALGASEVAAQTTPDCVASKSVVAREPTSVTPLERRNYSAYLNDDVPSEQASELHLISSYNGSGRIVVRPTAKPVVLVIGAYKSGLWRIEIEPGGRLAKIVLAGRDSQRVTGVPADVTVVDQTTCGVFASSWELQNQGVRYMPDDFKHFLAVAQKTTDLIESSYQVGPDLGSEFTVPPSEPQYQRAERVATPARPRETVRLDPAAVLTEYEAMVAQAPAEFRPTMQILIALMKSGKLPALFPIGDSSSDARSPRGVRRLFESARRVATTARDRCDERFVLGRPEGETIQCARGNQFYVMGPGKDVIDDSWGDDIFNPGAGDDVISAGWGNDIVVLEAGWGDDIVSKTCHEGLLSDDDRTRLGWRYRYNNFIVFGPGIHPADVTWESKSILAHAPSKSRLTLQDDCFNLVFTEDGELKPFAVAAPPPSEPAEQTRRTQESYVDAASRTLDADIVLTVDRATFEAIEKHATVQALKGVARVVRRGDRLMLAFSTAESRGVIEIRLKAD
jgi:hypothetical protein